MDSDQPEGKLMVSVFARTDIGQRRDGNEDAFLVADLTTGRTGIGPDMGTHQVGDRGSLLVVADGMGGAAAGEVASEMTVRLLQETLMKLPQDLSVAERLHLAVQQSNRLIWQHAQQHCELTGMGATLTAVLIHDGMAFIAQIGDSRAYLVRGDQIKQLTKDQSVAQLLADSGSFSQEVIDSYPRNELVQAMGVNSDLQVALVTVELFRNDVLLVCSDGLYNKVKSEEMRAVTLDSDNLAAACKRLVEMANERGGEDNITVVVAKFDGEALSGASEAARITGSWRLINDYRINDLVQREIQNKRLVEIPTAEPEVIVADEAVTGDEIKEPEPKNQAIFVKAPIALPQPAMTPGTDIKFEPITIPESHPVEESARPEIIEPIDIANVDRDDASTAEPATTPVPIVPTASVRPPARRTSPGVSRKWAKLAIPLIVVMLAMAGTYLIWPNLFVNGLHKVRAVFRR